MRVTWKMKDGTRHSVGRISADRWEFEILSSGALAIIYRGTELTGKDYYQVIAPGAWEHVQYAKAHR